MMLYTTRMHMQTTNTQAGLCCSAMNGLLTSDFGSSTRGERHNFYYANHLQRSAHLVVFRSQFIFAGRDLKNLTATATVENLTQWQRTQFSIYMAKTQLSACMVQSQTLNWLFFKILKFSAHLCWAWCHPDSSPIFWLGFIMTITIVISFACKHKLYPMIVHLD